MGKGLKPLVGKTCRYLSNVKSAIDIKNYKTLNFIKKINEIIIVITYDSESISMAGTIQCYQKMKKEFKSYHES
ncbi:hypothetical protein NIES3806_38070 [Microcystis aeruginosa NIES-3806]|nr:hypothetical protein NIES3806_38070 [Microcystis aeruginosa NIES-3806]